jgi:three-Cys-motif partner protein
MHELPNKLRAFYKEIMKQAFGGNWTTDKLVRVGKYLSAYTTIMNKEHFRFAYIDAFAGSGYCALKKSEDDGSLQLPVFAEAETKDFVDGSARVALQVKPRFHRYIFIEKDITRIADLEKLKADFPALKDSIVLVNADANTYLTDLCQMDWSKNRAVLFLDPYGMQVEWQTIAAIAKTGAIDLWILFPLGVAVNRLLKKDGKIDPCWRKKLDAIWYSVFYKTKTEPTLFNPAESYVQKVADFNSISMYFVKRLKSIFPGVAENPLPLLNTRNIPLYLLCFASGNRKGAPTAIKIAQDILRS